jgi:hypothetical protein
MGFHPSAGCIRPSNTGVVWMEHRQEPSNNTAGKKTQKEGFIRRYEETETQRHKGAKAQRHKGFCASRKCFINKKKV